MVLDDLKKIPCMQTRTIAAAAEDPQTHNYIVDCLQRFYSGDYGEVCADDTAANNADLAAGEGHILARYKQAHKLTGDFYIEAMIYEPMLNDINYNYIMVMYPDER